MNSTPLRHFDRAIEELEELIEQSKREAAEQSIPSFKDAHLAEADFFSAVLNAKKAGIHRSETLVLEAEELFGKRDMLKISAEGSALLARAAILLIEGLLK